MSDSCAPAIFKFSGAGNDFVVLDGRQGTMEAFRQPSRIGELCRQFRTDGLMILGLDPEVDFAMEFYNPDGSGGMMCGNGGRCIVAFADYLGLRPAAPDGTWFFRAPDGLHTAVVLAPPEKVSLPRKVWTVRLKMIDVQGVEPMKGGYFLNTGTRHFVRFVEEVDAVEMDREAKPLRWDPAFQPEGTNVNFVQVAPDGLHVRTFEKGVEGETLACGTGLTASAIAAYVAGIPGQAGNDGVVVGNAGVVAGKDGTMTGGVGGDKGGGVAGGDRPSAGYRLQCRRGDWLQVDFRPGANNTFTDVYLTGPAELVFKA